VRRLLKAALFLVLFPVALILIVGNWPTSRGWNGPVSDHFDGETFHIPVETPHRGHLGFLWMRLTTEYAEWPERVEIGPPTRPEGRLAAGHVRATFVNHATMLLQVGPVNILTDPIWSPRTSPVEWLGPARVHDPGVRFEDLPPIDAVVVSHDHYDHLDIATLQRLTRTHQPLVLAGLGLENWLDEQGVGNLRQLDWGDSVEVGEGVRITMTPSQHWSGRNFADRRRTLWGSYVIESEGHRIYFAGDTAAGAHFAAVRRDFGPVDLALLPIGAYAPAEFMSSAHLNPEEAVAAHRQLESTFSIGIHFGCFQLTQEARDEPAQRLIEARSRAGLERADFAVPAVGEAFDLPRPDSQELADQ